MAIRVSKRDDGTLMVHFHQDEDDLLEMSNHFMEEGEALGHPLGALMHAFAQYIMDDTTYDYISGGELDPKREIGHFVIHDSDADSVVVSVQWLSDYYSRERTLRDAYDALEVDDPAVKRNRAFIERQAQKKETLWGLRDRILALMPESDGPLRKRLEEISDDLRRATRYAAVAPHPEDLAPGPKTPSAGRCCDPEVTDEDHCCGGHS